ncbi:MAG: DUF1566 domain-containing protein, partial [Deltaproteobacteria bacterium]|nr:DUF1566 domain-containing protein [Deltaproteobacteria bacterium]
MPSHRTITTLFAMLILFCYLPDAWGGTINLPKTGQTTCYRSTGGIIACTNTGQDGDKQAGVLWPSPRFNDNGNGTVYDNLTGLIWLKNANCFGAKTWTDSLPAANGLANGSCGLTDGSQVRDWRLPSRKELRSLIDHRNYSPALPTGHPFIGVQSFYYWSSTTNADSTSNAWIVYTPGGHVISTYKTSTYYVWPVRGGQSGSLGPCGSLGNPNISGMLRGVVYDSDENPVTGATVSVYNYPTQPTPIMQIQSLAFGVYNTGVIPSSNYYVKATKDGLSSPMTWVSVCTFKTLDLTLRSGKPVLLFVPGGMGSTSGQSSDLYPKLPGRMGVAGGNLKVLDPDFGRKSFKCTVADDPGDSFFATSCTFVPHTELGIKAFLELFKKDYDVVKVPYDWRMSIDDSSSTYLKDVINGVR